MRDATTCEAGAGGSERRSSHCVLIVEELPFLENSTFMLRLRISRSFSKESTNCGERLRGSKGIEDGSGARDAAGMSLATA